MKIKFKQVSPKASTPCVGTTHSAGIDLRLSEIKAFDKGVYTLGLGVAVQIPYHHFGMLVVRSSIGAKGLSMTNSVGIIDADYRGELMMKCTFNHRGHDFPEIGERIAQLVIVPYVRSDIEIVADLNDTIRGTGGFGSTNE